MKPFFINVQAAHVFQPGPGYVTATRLTDKHDYTFLYSPQFYKHAASTQEHTGARWDPSAVTFRLSSVDNSQFFDWERADVCKKELWSNLTKSTSWKSTQFVWAFAHSLCGLEVLKSMKWMGDTSWRGISRRWFWLHQLSEGCEDSNGTSLRHLQLVKIGFFWNCFHMDHVGCWSQKELFLKDCSSVAQWTRSQFACSYEPWTIWCCFYVFKPLHHINVMTLQGWTSLYEVICKAFIDYVYEHGLFTVTPRLCCYKK